MEYKIKEKLFGANKRSASGTSLTLNDTVKYPINKLTIDGVCEQKTRSGKNLFRGLTLSLTNNGLTSTYSDINSNEVTINGTSTKNWANISSSNKEILPVGTYTLSINKIQSFDINIKGIYEDDTAWQYSISKGDTTITFTAIMNVKKFYIFISDSTNFTANTTFKIELNEGSTASNEFDQYGASPSPDYPQEIKTLTGDIKLTSCGKNIFNLANSEITSSGLTTTLINNIIKYSGTATNSYQNATLPRKYKIFKGSYNLILSNALDVGFQIRFQKTQNFMDGGFIVSIESGQTSKKFIIKENYNYCYLILTMKNGNTYSGSAAILLVNDTVDTTYEPYQDSSLNITIPSNEFVGKLDDTYKDTLNVVYKEDGHYHLILKKMIGKVVLNGSEGNIYAFYENPGDYNQINATLGITNIDTTNKYDFRCNYFGYYDEKATGNKTRSGMVKYGTNPNFVFSVPKTIITATSTWRNWISTHNVIIYYPFATSYEVDLGIVDTLLSYDEITNIFTDSDLYPVINVKYYNGSLDISNYEFSIKEV